MSIEELKKLIPPPANPTNLPDSSGWDEYAEKLGLTVPQDYKDYIETYGSGALGYFLTVLNPFSNMAKYLDKLKEILRSIQNAKDNWRKIDKKSPSFEFNIYPEQPGLLPWGGDGSTNYYCWLTEGDPSEWSVVMICCRFRELEQFDLSFSSFLSKSFSGKIEPTMWPDDIGTDDMPCDSFKQTSY